VTKLGVGGAGGGALEVVGCSLLIFLWNFFQYSSVKILYARR